MDTFSGNHDNLCVCNVMGVPVNSRSLEIASKNLGAVIPEAEARCAVNSNLFSLSLALLLTFIASGFLNHLIVGVGRVSPGILL